MATDATLPVATVVTLKRDADLVLAMKIMAFKATAVAMALAVGMALVMVKTRQEEEVRATCGSSQPQATCKGEHAGQTQDMHKHSTKCGNTAQNCDTNTLEKMRACSASNHA